MNKLIYSCEKKRVILFTTTKNPIKEHPLVMRFMNTIFIVQVNFGYKCWFTHTNFQLLILKLLLK